MKSEIAGRGFRGAVSLIALGVALGGVMPAHAQDSAVIAQELAQMRAEMERMARRIDDLEGQLAQARAETGSAVQAANEAKAVSADAGKTAAATQISWKGAPKFEAKGGWSFKPRGRVQVDAGIINAPSSTGRPDGFASEFRRIRFGIEGDIPGGFGYRMEADMAGNEIEVMDAYLTYTDGGLKLTAGQHNNFQGLEELTSSNFISMMERAAFTDAFGFERRLGFSAQYAAGAVLLQGGVFADNQGSLPNNNWSVDGRIVFMPKLGDAQLHFGASVHHTELGGAAASVRYRQRPMIHTTDERFINTGSFSAASETGYGLEAAYISGRFHATGEAFWQAVRRPGVLADPTFFGGYAEVGYFLTTGDTRTYKSGIFDRVKPANPVGKGGIGAVQVNLRYDRLDLTDDGILGGAQNGYQVSLVWTPTEYTRFLLNYGRMQYIGAAIPAAADDRSYAVDAFGMRAQVDF